MARDTTGSGRSSDGRTRLLEAAERLLDEHGIDGTTAAAIVQAAGHRNAAAVNYHFGNLDGLIEEVLLRRTNRLNEQRHAMLDELEADGPPEPRAVFRVLIAPLAALLDRPDGRRYLRLLNQAANHPRFHHRAEWQFTTSMARAATLLTPALAHVRPDVRRHRARHLIGMVLFALADQAWLIDTPQPERAPLPTEEFVEDLVVTGLAALSA